MFLTRDDLIELTGYKQSSAQVTWLRQNGVDHYVRKDGRPVVCRSAVEAREVPRARPDFSKLAPGSSL